MSEDLEKITHERVKKYLDITSRARKKATPLVEKGTAEERKLHILLRMAINYAHAWIDAGVKLGLLDGHGDDVLFTLP